MRPKGSVGAALLYATVLSIFLGCAADASAATAKDLDAIEAVVRKMVAVVNGPAFARAPSEKRVEMLKQFYRSDSSLKPTERSMFFGPFPDTAVGVDKYLADAALGFDWIFGGGGRYALRVDELQITAGATLAVAVSTNTFTITSKEGRTLSASKGRATAVFENVGGRWLISHEHLSAIDPQTWSNKQVEKEIKKRRQ